MLLRAPVGAYAPLMDLKPDLLVLLGTGATMPHIPGVAKTTELLRALEISKKYSGEPPERIFDRIAIDCAAKLAALPLQDGEAHQVPHFEDLLGIAEYFSNAFAKRTLTDLFQQNSLGNLSEAYLQGCYAVLRWISEACDVAEREPLPIVRGLEELAEHFRLWVFSLNYDDVPEHSKKIKFFTGYETRHGDGPVDGDSRFFATQLYDGTNQYRHDNVHLHLQLHGSVLFGPDSRQQGVLPRFPDRGSARATWDKKLTYQQISGGKRIPRLPMVTGYGKANSTLGEPFGTYMGLLRRVAMLTPAWLVVGYGGSDPHVNACLKSAMLQSVEVRHLNGFHHAVVVDYLKLKEPTRLDLDLKDPLGNALATKFFFPWAEADILSSDSVQLVRECTFFHQHAFNRLSKRLSFCLDGTQWAMTTGMPELLKRLKMFQKDSVAAQS